MKALHIARFSRVDWFFFAFLLIALFVGLAAFFAEDQAFWSPIAATFGYFVVASIFVNLFRMMRFSLGGYAPRDP